MVTYAKHWVGGGGRRETTVSPKSLTRKIMLQKINRKSKHTQINRRKQFVTRKPRRNTTGSVQVDMKGPSTVS